MEIDRTKHDIDVIERVLGSVNEDGAWSEVVEVTARPWLGGITSSAVRIHVGGVRPDDDQRRER